MTAKFVRNRATWMAYILIAFYGYFLNVLGPITPFLHDEFQLSYTVSSLHFSAFAVGILVVGLAGHLVIDRAGRWQALGIGAVGLGLGALLLVLGRAPVITVGACFLMGCVGSLILAVVPAALSEEHGELRGVAISEANVLCSLVSATAPFLVGWLVRLLIGWRVALVAAALLSILIGAFVFRRGSAPAARPRAGKDRLRAGEGRTRLPGKPAGGLPKMYWFYWAALVLAVSVEFCNIFWSADYLQSQLGLPAAAAAQAVSLFLGGMIMGRFAASRVLRRFSPRSVVLASILLGLAGFLLYWSASAAWVGLAGLALTGLGVASLYPILLSLAIGASDGNEAQAGARATLASGVAILLLPLVLGRLADLIGLRPAFGVIVVLFIAMLVMMLAVARDFVLWQTILPLFVKK